MHARAFDLNYFGVEVDDEIAGLDHGLGMTLGAADDGVDARDQLVLVKGLGHVVVGAEAKPPDLVLDASKTREDQVGVLTLETRRLRNASKPDMSGRLRSRRMMS